MIPNLCRKALVIMIRAFFISTVLLVGCQINHVRHNADNSSHVNVIKPIYKVSPASVAQNSYTVSFVGDVILHERLRKREEKVHEGFYQIWSSVQKYLDQADIRYANLEGPVAEEIGGVTGFPLFNYPEQIIKDLKKSGFDIVSTANNHALDRQAAGIKSTIQKLKKHDLKHTGTISSNENLLDRSESWWGLTQLKGSTRFLAWIACTEMTNGNKDKLNQVLYCYKDKEKIVSLINELKQQPQIAGIILNPHWGEEELFEIEAGRRLWAHKMINLGALAVVGSHPHVVQKIEDYVSEDGRKTFIAYSMGNFISNQPWVPNKTSMMLFAKFEFDEDQKLQITDYKYLPLWMNRTIDKDGTSKFRIEPVFDFAKKPEEAVQIWNEVSASKNRFRNSTELELFLNK